MKEIATLEKLKEIAIPIDDKTIAIRPKEDKKVIFNPSVERNMEKCFCSDAGILSFVTDGKMYAIPYMASVMQVLNDAGFNRKTMFVPFTKGEYPLAEKSKWEKLNKMAENEIKERFTASCIRYSEKHGFGRISDDLLDNHCMEVPEHGLKVTDTDSSTKTYFPQITGTYFGKAAENSIGKYCIINGICSFVYRNGKTYFTKNNKVILALQEAGYRLGNLLVPMINGETIADPKQAERWQSIA